MESTSDHFFDMSVVNRCICHKITFEEIKKIAISKNLTSVEQLQYENICTTHCQLCRPYIEKMLETGETSFKLIP